MSKQSKCGNATASREVDVGSTHIGSERSSDGSLSFVVVATFALLSCSEEGSAPTMDGVSAMAGSGEMLSAGTGMGGMPSAGSVAGTMSRAGTGAVSGTGGSGTGGTGAAGRMNTTAGTGDAGTSAGAGAGGTMMSSAGVGGSNTAGTSAAGMPSDDAYKKYHDPGTGEWEAGTPEQCKMDPSRIRAGNNLAVFRYGKRCHIQGGNTSGQNFSATKTLGGVLGGRAAYLVKDAMRNAPSTGPILHEDKVSYWGVSTSGINANALISHVMAMNAFNTNLAYGSKRFAYDTLGTREITKIVDVAMVAVKQVTPPVPTQSGMFMQQQVFDKLGMKDSNWAGGTIGTGWTGTLEDMARVGVMLVHDGWYGGERFMEASWVYRMSHPSHEDANTAYGQLAWLNNRGGGSSFGAEIDTCAPAAFWPEYPHVGSEAPDCGATSGGCEQEHDVGVFSAQGLGGQFIVMHPGLDLVIVAHNAAAPRALWAAVRPAVVAMDPKFMGDEMAFCEAYGKGAYAPDLLVPRVAPTK